MCIFNFKNNTANTSALNIAKRPIFEVFVAFLCLLVVLALLEIILITFNNFGHNGPQTLKPLEEGEVEIYYGQLWKKNEFKQRIYRNTLELPTVQFVSDKNTKYRIAIIGDSVVQGKEVSIDENFAMQAEKMIPNIKIYPIGHSGATLPLNTMFYKYTIPKIFGPKGTYPSVDAIIFTTSHRDINYINYEYPPTKWQAKILFRIKSFLEKKTKLQSTNRFNSISLLSFKIYQLIRQNYNRVNPLDEQRYTEVLSIYKNEILMLLRQLARDNRTPIAILYIPEYGELLVEPAKDNKSMKDVTQIIQDLNLPFENAFAYYSSVEDAHFKADGHPNKKGHYFLALALRSLILEHLFTPDKKENLK